MTPAVPRLRHRIEATAARAFLRSLRGRDFDAASALGGRLARMVGPLSGAHRTAEDNLRRAFPEMAASERAAVLQSAWDNLGRTVAEYAVLPALWRAGAGDRLQVTGTAALAEAAATGRPALLFSAHLGNWEMIPLALAGVKPLTIVYRPPNNRLIDAMIGDIRAAYTAAMAPKGAAGARMILKGLGRGEHVFMVVDQKINSGLEIPFFGRGAFTGPAIALFAMKFRCPVFPVRCRRADGARFAIEVEQPLFFDGDADDQGAVRAALLQVNQCLERWIRETPGQWLWMHKRWPR